MVLAGSVAGSAGWERIGLKNDTVSCILMDQSTGLLLAGTQRGLVFMDDSGEWGSFDGVSLPVHAMEKTFNNQIVVAAGSPGNKSNGIYIGTRIRGYPYYRFSVLTYCDMPTALDCRLHSVDSTIVYVGSGNSVYYTVIGDYPVGAVLTAIKTPDYCFGVEMPYCDALHVYTPENALYAGGFDTSPLPGPGSLIETDNDTVMKTVQEPLDVTALTEAHVVPTAYSNQLMVGTQDSGVLYYRRLEIVPMVESDNGVEQQQDGSWHHIPSPNDMPVDAMLRVPTIVAQPREYTTRIWPPQYNYEDPFFIATAHGVYRKCPYNADCRWSEVGDIIARVHCLASTDTGVGEDVSNDSLVLAGTDRGVYLYRDVTAVKHNTGARTARRTGIHVGHDNGTIRIAVPSHTDDKFTAIFFDARGRCVRRVACKASTTLIRDLHAGLYYYRITNTQRIYRTGVLHVMQ
jgi:hypothetical protein